MSPLFGWLVERVNFLNICFSGLSVPSLLLPISLRIIRINYLEDDLVQLFTANVLEPVTVVQLEVLSCQKSYIEEKKITEKKKVKERWLGF